MTNKSPGSKFAIRKHTSRSGAVIPFTELGFGTAPLGNLYRALDEDVAALTVNAAWDAGIRYFDTAPLYGLGLAETRLNPLLRRRKREDYVLSTKIGRLLKVVPPDQRTGIGKFFDTPSRQQVYDYSYDGVMRSVEFSLERLGIDTIDVLLAHDVDIFTHGSKEASDQRIKELMEGGYRALEQLRSEGTVKAIGAGINEWQVAETLARAGDFDVFLLAGRYTLLEQDALTSFLPYCVEKKIGIVLGGPYNSGILATGPRPGAFYNYDPAPPAILDRVARIERVCASHHVKLVEAALKFPLGHPQVVSVIPGGQSPHEVTRNAEIMAAKIPAGLWDDLKAEGLLREDAPVPA
ncbi:aldo/keto reductase [Labrys sp. KNU-23]|uniref:aldo/keto reductase n=1 Tax=Labrys sp. KNU-23 TaxID=2789216 RepID=UPI0011EC2DEA|nr:aldo/keto reductase [Labrys sp. KNU-23]QEN87024.1 aldo/keto reductase [Labrys sp. KNU-23]